MLERVGPNTVDSDEKLSSRRLLGRQFTSPIVLILLGATVISGLLGEFVDAGIIVAIILASGLLGFWQEHSAARAMSHVLAAAEAEVSVVRDGHVVRAPISTIVPGDLANLSAGDLVPGDCVVLDERGLTVDESALTGASAPVDKTAGVSSATSDLSVRHNMLFLGTHVVSGLGTVLVIQTGRDTEFGRAAKFVKRDARTTAFERGMTSFGLLVSRMMVALVVVIFAVNLVFQRPLIASALFALALAVGLSPQLLPAIVSISLARGARSMAHAKVIVRRLDALEDFGAMSILCCDKTGTMTEGRIALDRALAIDATDSAEVLHLARLNAMSQIGLRNALDDAIVAASELTTGEAGDARKLDEVPYDFTRRRLSVLVRESAGSDCLLITKGAAESVLSVCTSAQRPDGSVVELDLVRNDIIRLISDFCAKGFRVLAVATRSLGDQERAGTHDEARMTFRGVVTFADPPRDAASTAVRALADSGVSVRMLTGDSQLVAAHIAAEIGLSCAGMLTGTDIGAMADEELATVARSTVVFSELTPPQKERVVSAMQTGGAVVGYLGDGINDAPALRAADVGISAEGAVPVAKAAASIVLLAKDLGVLHEGVLHGRRVFANTMKYVFMTTSANFGNMLSMAVAAVTLPFLPLAASQILLINLFTDLPATMIATDTVESSQVRRPQRWDTRLIWNYMIVFGALSSVFDLTTFAALRIVFDADVTEFRSAWFLGSILTEIGVLFVLRTRGPFYSSKPSWQITCISLVVIAATFAVLYSPVAGILGMEAVPLPMLTLVLTVVLTYLVATEVAKPFFWRRFGPR